MKTKGSFILKASTALVLALLMLFGTVATSIAAVVDDLAATGWTSPFHIYGTGMLGDSWTYHDVYTLNSTDNQYAYDVYAKHSSGDWNTYFKWQTSDGNGGTLLGLASGDADLNTSHKTTNSGNDNIHFNNNWISNDSKWHKITFVFKNNGSGETWWYDNASKSDLSISSSLSSVSVGTSYNLGNYLTTSNNFGTVTYTYKVKGPGDSSYSTVSSPSSWSPTKAGTYSFQVTANDGAVVAKTNAAESRTKTSTFSVTSSIKQNYYVWGGSKQDLNGTSYNTTLTYNAATGLYDGTYTFTSGDWHSILMSRANDSNTFEREWTAYNQVKWAHDTYNNNAVYGGNAYLKKEDLAADDVLTWIEITENNSSSWGIKLAARAEGTTINLSYDATNKILYLWGGTGSDKATIYAKDGCINIRKDAQQGTTRVIGTTAVTSSTNVTDVARQALGGENCYTYAKAKKGEEITVTTTVNATYASKYLVKGWDVNGTTYGLDPTAVGTAYSATFTVPDADKVEITPIYWLKNGDVTTFFVNNFDQVPSGWGSALYYYYWGGSQVNVSTEEVYPGQPFVHEGGQYYAQVPKDVTGVTLNNAVWDTIHGQNIMGVGDQQSKNHWQTYDYDNFAKIAKEKSDLNSVYFSFKYESAVDNFGSTTGNTTNITLSNYGANGWEDYKNPLGEDINIFGDKITTPDSKTLYVISNGYARNYQGNYATEWSIYCRDTSVAPTLGFIATIPSSALILDSESDFSTYGDSGYGPDIADYKAAWKKLKTDYTNCKVKITYEMGMYGDKTRINTSGKTPSDGSDYATRIDGKWDYILNSSYSTADIIIQKSDDNGATYSEDAFVSDTNQGTTTQATAYFTNTGASYADKHVVTTDDRVVVSTTNKYKLKTVPQPSTGYQFVGWYRLDDGSETPSFISKSNEAESLMSAKATFIARYKKVTDGNLVINHNVDGAGKATNHTVKVEIFAADATPGKDDPITSFTGESVPLGSTYISSNSTYKIRVTLTAIADANTSYIANSSATPTVTCSQAAATYYNQPAYTRNGRFDASVYPQNVVTTVDTFTIASLYGGNTTQDFTVLNYTTTFNKLPTYTINYKYHGRQSTGASDYLTFTRTITLSPDEAEGKDSTGTSYSGNNGTALRPTYITTANDGLVNDITANAPDQNSLETDVFNKNITWSAPSTVTASPLDVYATETDPTYTLTYTYYDDNGTEHSAQTVTGAYNTLIRFGETSGTVVTASTLNSQKFAYWADANDKPLTNSILYSMRLIDNVTIHPVYGTLSSGWESAIDKITRTHETSDTSDNVYTDFALRFTGFDGDGAFIHINPDYTEKYTVGVAVVYDTEGNNTTNTTEQIDGYPFYNLAAYTDAKSMIQTLVTKDYTAAKLSKISATTRVVRFNAANSNLTNLNRIDLAVKYDYSQNYKRSYDAYAYIIDNSTSTVIAVSPVKSGYLYDGTLPVGN